MIGSTVWMQSQYSAEFSTVGSLSLEFLSVQVVFIHHHWSLSPLYLWSGMSQDSQHGKWTVSSSDDDDDPPPSRTSVSQPDPPAVPRESSTCSASSLGPKQEPKAASVGFKPEPDNTPVTALAIGSEARQLAAKSQLNPVKYENTPSLAGKRKIDVSEGSGWALSDSEDDDDVKVKSLPDPPKKEPSSPKTKKAKVTDERPPSPHGRVYYIDEPEDFFESTIPCSNEPFRFYLNKVTGLDRKFNTGALHIRGEEALI